MPGQQARHRSAPARAPTGVLRLWAVGAVARGHAGRTRGAGSADRSPRQPGARRPVGAGALCAQLGVAVAVAVSAATAVMVAEPSERARVGHSPGDDLLVRAARLALVEVRVATRVIGQVGVVDERDRVAVVRDQPLVVADELTRRRDRRVDRRIPRIVGEPGLARSRNGPESPSPRSTRACAAKPTSSEQSWS
jgi:hypothetical protein